MLQRGKLSCQGPQRTFPSLAQTQAPPLPSGSSFPGGVSGAGPSGPQLRNGSEPPPGRELVDPEDLNLTLEELRLKYLGPRRSRLFGPICAAYLPILAVGAAGNALTCLVILRHKAMRTPTNHYLLSLAVSDLLVLLLGMPLELYELWRNYPFGLGAGGCYFRTLLFETACLASVLNVTALSVGRYVAVAHPLRAKAALTRARARRVIAALWAAAVLCSLPNTSLHGLLELEVPGRGVVPDSAVCTLVRPRALYNLVVQGTALLFFGLPVATMGTLYALIGLRLRRERRLWARAGSARAGGPGPEKLRQRQLTKMLFVLVVVFGLCWAPFHVDRLMWSCVSSWTEELLQAFQYVHVASGVFFYLSSAANPVLYSLLSSRFRGAFRQALGLRGRGRPGTGPAQPLKGGLLPAGVLGSGSPRSPG
ncbi:neuromedin-U receptor 1 [Antechinus flavipes]|uniref:neuromedin-U receptor 1 n=1 Tax=Antechinus flavipes TaxID=38775 RepID=UPI0022356550|nr:neuromedin-U receptor 1 [Antechinus flavipes]